MKRPLTLVGFVYLFALFVSMQLDPFPNMIISIILFLFAIVLFLLRKRMLTKIYIVAALTSAMAFLVYDVSYVCRVKPKLLNESVTTKVSGNICDLPYESYGRFHYIVDTDNFGKIKISSDAPIECDLFDKIEFDAKLFPITGSGLFSKRSYYMSKGILATGYVCKVSDIDVLKNNGTKPFYYYALKVREAITKSIRILLPGQVSAMSRGMLLGDKYDIDETISENFRDLGISHLLAVSGLHMSVITNSLMFVLKKLRLGRKLIAIFTATGAFVFMAITGFSPSVTRAGIMSIVCVLSVLVSRKPDSINSLGFALLIILLVNPFAAADLGLLLSFFATLGILLFGRSLELSLSKYLPKFLSGTFAMTISASILTFPFIALSFKKFSVISLVANVLIVLPSLVMMPLILLAAILYFIKPIAVLGKLVAFIAGTIVTIVLKFTSCLASLPVTSISVGDGYVLFWIMGTLILFSVAFFLNVKSDLNEDNSKFRYVRMTSLLSVILFLIGFFSNMIATKDKISLSVLDVGKGLSIVVRRNDRAMVLSSGGSKYMESKVTNFLSLHHVDKIDYMMIPTLNNDSCLFADKILQKYCPYTVSFPENDNVVNKITMSLLPQDTTYRFDKSLDVNVWGCVHVDAFSYKKRSVLLLTIYGVRVLICPNGVDVSKLPENFKSCDFFVVSSVPKNQEEINSLYVILSGDEQFISKKISHLIINDRIPLATGSKGDVTVNFCPNRTISFER